MVLVIEMFLLVRLGKERTETNGSCNILLYLMTRILLIVAFVMVAINLYYMKFIDPNEFLNGTANRRIPYITILVMGPIVSLMVVWAYVMRNKLSICKVCRKRYGPASERGFLGKVFRSESRYQLRILFYIFTGITIYASWYYWKHYSNVNFNRADQVFYLYIPIIIIFLSIVFLGRRYLKIFAFYRDNVIGEATEERNTTLLRFLIICDDYIFMRNPEQSEDLIKIDTPLVLKMNYTDRVSEFEVKNRLCHAAQVKESAIEVKYLYENVDRVVHSNILHYLCQVQSRSAFNESKLKGEWLNLYQLRSLYESGMLAQMLVGEIDRLYTIAMARKTYDKNGKRLYKVKHYTPSFKLRDLGLLDVDYNDPEWLLVSKNNEDQPFF